MLGLSHQDASAILRKAQHTATIVLGRPNDPSNYNKLAALQQELVLKESPDPSLSFTPNVLIPSPSSIPPTPVVPTKIVSEMHIISLNKVQL